MLLLIASLKLLIKGQWRKPLLLPLHPFIVFVVSIIVGYAGGAPLSGARGPCGWQCFTITACHTQSLLQERGYAMGHQPQDGPTKLDGMVEATMVVRLAFRSCSMSCLTKAQFWTGEVVGVGDGVGGGPVTSGCRPWSGNNIVTIKNDNELVQWH